MIRWKSESFQDYFLTNNLVFGHIVVASTWYENPTIYGIDRNTGSVIWQTPFGILGAGSITENGMIYGTDAGSDIFYAIDAMTGDIKWTYDFQGGLGTGIFGQPGLFSALSRASWYLRCFCLRILYASAGEYWLVC